MYTTAKKSRMISQLELDTSGSKEEEKKRKIRGLDSVERRVVVLCLTTWHFGYCFTYMSPLGPNNLGPIYGPFMGSEEGIGPCFGLIPFGAAVGVVVANLLINKLSRRTFLVIVNIFNIIFTGILQINNSVVLYVFRILQGVCVGCFMSIVPEYISDLSPKQLGSRFGVYPQVSVVLGVLVAFSLGVLFTDINSSNQVFWRVMFIIPAVPSVIQLFFIFIGYIPQSPDSLIVQNMREEARDIISLFYEEQFVDTVLEEKENKLFNSKGSIEDQIRYTGIAYYLGFHLSIFQVLSGIACYVTQAGHVMSFSLNQPVIGLYTPVLITLSQLVGTFISIPMLKYIEWRTLTLIGGFSCAAANALIGLFLYEYYVNQDYGNILLTMISEMAYMFTFGITLGSSVWPYINYMLPSRGVTAALVINWLLAGGEIVAFSFVTYTMGNPFVLIWIFCGVTFISSIINSILMVNVRGLSVRKVHLKFQ